MGKTNVFFWFIFLFFFLFFHFLFFFFFNLFPSCSSLSFFSPFPYFLFLSISISYFKNKLQKKFSFLNLQKVNFSIYLFFFLSFLISSPPHFILTFLFSLSLSLSCIYSSLPTYF